MAELIKCGTHGAQEESFVCKHIIASLKDGEPRGFHWDRVDDAFEAICSDCNELSEEAFIAQAPDLISALCFGCFKDAAAMNGVDID